jgi:hypothetical protein
MKKISIDGKDLYYEVDYGPECDLGAYFPETKFYNGPKIITLKTFFSFLNINEVNAPNFLFELDFNIEHHEYSKEYIKDCIKQKLDYTNKTLRRKEEIAMGQII